MSISSIDEMLMGGSTSQAPMSPEERAMEVPEPVEEQEADDYGVNESAPDTAPEDNQADADESDDNEPEDKPKKETETDEYGNVQEPENEVIRERLARQARKHEAEITELRAQLARQGASTEVQQAARDFEYDPEGKGDWQQQLASFVKQTVHSMTADNQRMEQEQIENAAQQEFQAKFRQGMDRFADFMDVVDGQPLDTAMTLALRGMPDPAAFIYAASKRQPQELERISKLRDPYARMVEMGKLEERMKRNKPTTKAPRPLGRTTEDATTKVKAKDKDNSGDDLLAHADAKRMSIVKTRLKSNR